MKKDNISLLKALNLNTIFKMEHKAALKLLFENVSGEAKDERILSENNKIYCIIFNLIIVVLLAITLFTKTLNLNIIGAIIGITNYIGLIMMCKKNIIESNPNAFGFFFWSFFTLPICLFNVFNISILNVFIIIVLVIVLYIIANTVYKKNNNY